MKTRLVGKPSIASTIRKELPAYVEWKARSDATNSEGAAAVTDRAFHSKKAGTFLRMEGTTYIYKYVLGKVP